MLSLSSLSVPQSIYSKKGVKRSREEGDESNASGLSVQENEKLQGVLSGRAGLDGLGFSAASNSKITLSSSMEMLQSLPDSVRGCLMEAARLCAPPVLNGAQGDKTKAPAAAPSLKQDSSLAAGSLMPDSLLGLGLDSTSIQALQKIHTGLNPKLGAQEDLLIDTKHSAELGGDKNDIFASILAADFLASDNDLHNDFLNSSQAQTPTSGDSEQWNLQGIENMLNVLAPSCY